MIADIARADGAEQRVGERVKPASAVGMRLNPWLCGISMPQSVT